SLLKQSHTNLEIIISDNCSTDATVKAVIDEFTQKDPRIKAFIQPKNIGMIPNFEFVLEQATADYFMWKADDDIIEDPDFLSKLYTKLNQSDSDFAFAEGYYLLNGGERKPILKNVYENCKSRFDYLNAFTKSFSCLEFYGLYNLKKFNKKTELKISDEVVCPDLIYLPTLFLNHKVLFVPETHYIYRHVPNNDTFVRNLNLFNDRQVVMRELAGMFAETEKLKSHERKEITLNIVHYYEFLMKSHFSISRFQQKKIKIVNGLKIKLGLGKG
ncbi:MAG TPA: glycosyltransferase family 2 protein, partial [Bacteroidia bacterium]